VKRFAARTMLVLILSFCSLAACAEVGEPRAVRQEIAVTLFPESHLLTGASTVTFAAGVNRVTFSLSPAAAIERVAVAGKVAPFSFAGGMLAIDLPREVGSASVSVTVSYRVTFNDPVPERPTSSEDPGYGVNGAITGQGVFLGSGVGWYPVTAATPERRIIRIAAPEGIEAVTSGRRIARETGHGVTRSTWEELKPVGDLSLSAGPYRIEERHMDGVDIYTYFYPDNARLSACYLDAAAKYIRFYSGLFGPYPFEKFAVVENFFPTGYGFPSYTLLGSAIIRLPFIVDTSFPHEIAHCWWGNGVLVGYRDGNWSEGLVTYLADYFLEEKKSPAAGRDYRLRLLTDYSSLVTPERDFPLRNFTGRVDPASRAIGYGKGAMLFHMVRSVIGDQAFFGALREICREKLYKTATWQDFTRAFSRSAGKDLTPFMEQWLARPGGPRLALADTRRRQDGGSWVVTGTIIQTPPLYDVSLPLRLETAGGPLRQTLRVDRERTPFSFSSSDLPRRLLMDPDVDLFRVLSSDELPPTVNRIKGSKNLLAVITRNCQAREETVRLLLESLGQGMAMVVSEDKIGATSLRDHDLLFCGAPQQQTTFPALPGGISVSRREFSVDGERFNGSDGLLFVVTRHPLAAGRVAALFLPLSDGAAERYVLKITHYGKYGYLVFAGGENRRKGMFAPAAGSVAEFN